MAYSVTVTQACPEDISSIAAVFSESFEASVLHHCGCLPKPRAMQDVFTLVYRCEPQAAFVAKTTDGRIVGYCFAPTALSRLWRTAIAGGYLFCWLWRWLSGQYGFGLRPISVIASNKFFFLKSAFTPGKAADARILSIAVASECRGQGIAFRLMQTALDYFTLRQAARIRLEVRPDNAAAIRVYRKCGFCDGGYTADSQGQWLIMFKEMEQNNV